MQCTRLWWILRSSQSWKWEKISVGVSFPPHRPFPLSPPSSSIDPFLFLPFICVPSCQGCSLGLERLGLETVSRRFLERLGLVSVLKVERLGLVLVLRVWKNRTSRSHLGLEGSTSRSPVSYTHLTLPTIYSV